MNKKGQSLIFGIMLLFFALIIVTIIIAPMVEVIDMARDTDHLNCTSPLLSTGTRATCLIIDIYLPYFVATALFLGGGYLVAQKVRKNL